MSWTEVAQCMVVFLAYVLCSSQYSTSRTSHHTVLVCGLRLERFCAMSRRGLQGSTGYDATFKRDPAQRASMDRPPKPSGGRVSLSADGRANSGAQAKRSTDLGRRGAWRSLEASRTAAVYIATVLLTSMLSNKYLLSVNPLLICCSLIVMSLISLRHSTVAAIKC